MPDDANASKTPTAKNAESPKDQPTGTRSNDAEQKEARESWRGPLRRQLIIALLAAFFAMVLAVLGNGLIIPAIQARVHPPQEDKIRQVIEQEAAFVVSGDMDQAVGLFDAAAVVRDAAGGDTAKEQRWVGQAEIRQRYAQLPHFVFLRHDAIEIAVSSDGKYARAVADTVEQYVVGTQVVDMLGNTGEKWILERINGDWKIASFTYGLY